MIKIILSKVTIVATRLHTAVFGEYNEVEQAIGYMDVK